MAIASLWGNCGFDQIDEQPNPRLEIAFPLGRIRRTPTVSRCGKTSRLSDFPHFQHRVGKRIATGVRVSEMK
jgi:hypothetical protein